MTRKHPLSEVSHFFGDLFDYLPSRLNFDLAIDLYKENNSLVAEMSAPGIEIKNTEIEVVDNVLRIRGHKEQKIEEKEKDYYCKEISRGSFERSVRLPCAVLSEQTKASYKNGILKVTMPLKKEGEHKRIEIAKE